MKGQTVTAFCLLLIVHLLTPSLAAPQDSLSSSQAIQEDDFMTVEGVLVCVSEEMAKLRDKKPNCPKYGHVVGLRVSDGTIWSFYPNPVQRELRDTSELGDRIRIKGRLFYDGKIIEIREYKLLPVEEVSKSP